MEPPPLLQQAFKKNKKASDFFEHLSFTNQREYVEWLLNAKKEETIQQRLLQIVSQLSAGKKTYNEK